MHKKIFIGMIAGACAGLIVQYSGMPAENIAVIVKWIKPVGEIFLRLIFMMVIPLIISALALGIAELGDLRKIGRVGLRTLYFTVLVSVISVIIGIGFVQLFQPGESISEADREMLMERFTGNTGALQQTVSQVKTRGLADIIVSLVPKNPLEDMINAFNPGYTGGGLLAVMFFSLMVGAAMAVSDREKVAGFRSFLEGLYEIVMKVIGFGMKLAPYGVASLLFALTATMGWSILAILSRFVLVVLLALAAQMFIVYSILLAAFTKTNPLGFFKNIREVMLVAFSTSSSNATLPTAIRVAVENLKLPPDIARFVLTIGSTANQNGTALYEGVTVLFLAQCFGIDLTISQQIFVVSMAILGGVGTAGVPSGSLPIIMLILISIGIPGESIGIIYGIDRLLDMCRTVLNVTGDLTAAVFVSKSNASVHSDAVA